MNIKTVFVIGLLSLGVAAASDAQVVSRAYELSLNNFRPPATENGSAAFKECDECTQLLVRVTAATRYTVNGTTVRLDEFKKILMQADDRENVFVGVLHHLESDTIKSIVVRI